MNIAVLYICTGKYNLFFKGFYKSAMNNLFVNAQKTFYVWTDDDHIGEGLPNVRVRHKECCGFPADSLFRFEMFMEVEDELQKYDYIFFFNANAEILLPIGDELLPDDSGLSMGIWPGREKQPPMLFPYERNLRSRAYVSPYGKDYVYYMGGLNGGTPASYIPMIRTLCRNIREDYDEGIVARVHDESHINSYLRTHRCKQIGKNGYLMPEEWIKKGDTPSIIFREKTCIDQYFNKNRSYTLVAQIKKGCLILWDVVRWYLKF